MIDSSQPESAEHRTLGDADDLAPPFARQRGRWWTSSRDVCGVFDACADVGVGDGEAAVHCGHETGNDAALAVLACSSGFPIGYGVEVVMFDDFLVEERAAYGGNGAGFGRDPRLALRVALLEGSQHVEERIVIALDAC
ncbi:MAG: hypothetical protein L0H93_18885 [Nocardioides sp.]|nr:hypothetical protein [Nocardioides sp.]